MYALASAVISLTSTGKLCRMNGIARSGSMPDLPISRLVAALPPGSYLVISHPTDDFNPNKGESMKVYNERSAEQAIVRDQAATARFVEGLALVEPGLVPVSKWRPESEVVAARPSSMWCGVARKPLRLGLAAQALFGDGPEAAPCCVSWRPSW